MEPDDPGVIAVHHALVCADTAKAMPVRRDLPARLVQGEWLYLKETVLKVKEDVEEDCGVKFPIFDALFFIQRDNHIIVKVHVGDEKYVDVSLMNQRLHSYELDKKESDSLKFD